MKNLLYFTLLLIFSNTLFALNDKTKSKDDPLDKINLSGLNWRSVGPSLTSGRISDIAVNPNNIFEYYVATSAGGVWKTINSGIDYTPVFDNEGSYSIGCVSIDPNNSNVIWVGSGENNNQRSVSYGDGVYKSIDGGDTWKNMGLKSSEHIGKIIIDPNNSNVIYVAAIGPLWSKGGERGLYKSIDGGINWSLILYIDENTGVNDVIIDPRNTDILYASSFQRRRHVFTYVGGGPGSGMHKSEDGGENWIKINTGLPTEEIGRIGLTISPANPEYIYAIVEAANGKGGFYRSLNKGASWKRQSSHSTSGNYYQEIIADPVDPNRVFSMDTWMTVTNDGGKTFNKVGEDFKHVDNHSIWINPNNNGHWLVGSDGGIYETFDNANSWDFKENLPVTQFYKVAVDNAKPFYNIYGGTQDNFSIGGPSRVKTAHGITNQDWFITHGGDGFESQVDPENPNIVYAQSQYGWLVRFDKLSGEEVGIKPVPRKGELEYKWNWDAPLAVSKHKSGRLYFAANKVFKSDDYGNSWDVISNDLSRKINRNELKVYDRVLSMDAVAKNGSTSPYGTIVSLSESPIDPNLIAVGTDDGLIQISKNGGQSWFKVDNISGVPENSYTNSIYLSKHDINVMYVAFNHHKYGDFQPYIYKTSNQGETWKSISNNLPERGSVYSIEEDHIDKDLIFCGTEFGVYFSPNAGQRWRALDNGLPTIAVRDIAIQERENDLILGTFGRGFYILDDYSSLRSIENSLKESESSIFSIRDALMWEKSMPLGLPGKAFQGDNFYSATNLDPVAMITYYHNKDFQSLKSKRQKLEKKLIENNKDVSYPTYDDLDKETNEFKSKLVFIIKNSEGLVVKKVFRTPKKGVQRFEWDLRYEEKSPISFANTSFYNPFAGISEGTLVNPGTYTVEMDLFDGISSINISKPISFSVISLESSSMPALNRTEKVNFQRAVSMLEGKMLESANILSEAKSKIKYFKEAIKIVEAPLGELSVLIKSVENKIKDISIRFYGNTIKSKLDIEQIPTAYSRLTSILYEQKYSTSAPTNTHIESFEIANEEFTTIYIEVKSLVKIDIKEIENKLKIIEAPHTPGRLKARN
ncbi:MAG: glycosyl hydrolase [Flavobacteriaceae bacterium]|nr:glycosyl hydrolase [Flavobacteriaceae bacterium]